MTERYEVVVVGSGAGGGVVAGELAERGRSVLLLEAGPHRTAADYMRWEARANHELWWPPVFAEPTRAEDPPLIMFRGRCVGGTTAINTKVALRPSEQDYEKWYQAAGLVGDRGEPFGEADLLTYLERVEARLGVRERSDWQQCVHTVVPGFRALGAKLEPVMSYTDANCMRCGACLQGCPTNAGKSTLNTYIHPPWVQGGLELRADCDVRGIVIEERDGGPQATGVQYGGTDGELHTVSADVVVIAAGALATPGLLIRSGVREAAGGSRSSELIGRHLGFHVARLVQGLFNEPPGRAHGLSHQRTLHEIPARRGRRLRGGGGHGAGSDRLRDRTVRRGRPAAVGRSAGAGAAQVPLLHWAVDPRQRREHRQRLGRRFRPRSILGRLQLTRAGAHRPLTGVRSEVLEAAGARRVFHTGVLSTHVQGSCRMGSDPDRSVVGTHGESHDVRRLFVGDSSVVPRTLSVNPSLTIMALASRLADDSGEHGYFGRMRASAAG